jgi:hypothetical protein
LGREHIVGSRGLAACMYLQSHLEPVSTLKQKLNNFLKNNGLKTSRFKNDALFFVQLGLLLLLLQ